MSSWGTPWGLGFPWGAPHPGATWGCSTAQSGLLSQSTGGDFSDWICAFGEEIGAQLDTLADLLAGYSLDYAVGAQLDTLGAIVGLPRSGVSDARYRTFLQIQTELLLSAVTESGGWTGTTENVLRICRKFIGPGSGNPIIAQTAPPYGFFLVVPDIADFTELQVLIEFIRKALYLAVLGQSVFVPEGDNLYCYEVQADTTGAGVYCYEVAADTAGAAVYSSVVLIGDP